MYPSHLDVIRLPSKGSKLWRVGSWILAVDGGRLGGENSTSASDAAGQLGYRNRVPFTFFLSDRVIQVDSTNWKFNVFHINILYIYMYNMISQFVFITIEVITITVNKSKPWTKQGTFVVLASELQ